MKNFIHKIINTIQIFDLLRLLFIGLLFSGIFLNLWERPLFGVEGRWAEGAREMSLRSSWFVPTINFEPHVTKPLIPFWLIKISGELFGFSEFTVRLPGALLGLFSVLIFYFLAKKLFEKEWALIGTALYGASLGFLEFSRLSQSEIYQLFGIVSALTVYIYYREKPSFTGYTLFIFALLFGALSKGLTAVAVLGLFVGLDIVLFRRFYHFNPKLFIILALGVSLYFLHYYLISKELQTQLPFYLWFRENLKQAVDPYDNLRPFYIYFYFWPLWIAPFSLFLPLALYKNFKNFKSLSQNEKLFFLTNLFIFLLFTLAKARRGYYLLPILPFTIITLTFYLKNLKEFFLVKLHQGIALFLPFLSLVSLYFLHKKGYPFNPNLWIGFGFTIIAQIFLLIKSIKISKLSEKFLSIILIFLLSEILYFSFLQPAYSSSTEKESGLFVKRLSEKNQDLKICSLSLEERPVANFYFYAEIKEKVEDLKKPEEALSKCKIIIIRKNLKEEWLNLFQKEGYKMEKFETKGDKSKNYYIFYKSSTLKTPSL
ncbi:hypothetical protein THC_1550 [Caldimicrobium thiodismutans]|uniref:Glycosyltransferase RgtA/B/C/D-like domain-containing protein n=1 Tax=Caldimicrobium thiodismutans TaxID=1653476 RepID=A0A0U4W4A5_9BACT|nr:glycosyltransferase family 39 protein [Caldimicrobium thiodismutans]BAU23915.1 hypothetical protein THC_1550 [Caldimicrobium thiodismutans]